MPLIHATENGKPGYKWGESGKFYTYISGNEISRMEAKKKAIKQAIAIGYSEEREKNKDGK